MTHSCESSRARARLLSGTLPIHPPSCGHTHDVKDRVQNNHNNHLCRRKGIRWWRCCRRSTRHLSRQVVAVPKLSLDRIPQRSAVLEVPTIVSFSSLQQQTAEQITDIPVPGRGDVRGEQGDLQGFASGQNSPALTVEQNVDIPVQVAFALFTRFKKVRHYLRAPGRHCLRTRAHGRWQLMTSLWCSRRRRKRSPRRSLTTTLSTWSSMVAGGGASGSRLASSIAGGWPRLTGPRLAILSGGPRGPSGLDQGDSEPPGYEFMALWTVLVYVPWWKRPCEHAAQVPAVFASQWKVLFPFIDSVLDIAGMLLETGAHSVYCAEEWRVHSAVLGRSCCRARCCERQERMGPDSAETVWQCRKCSSCGCGRRCEHAATSPGAPGRCFRPVH